MERKAVFFIMMISFMILALGMFCPPSFAGTLTTRDVWVDSSFTQQGGPFSGFLPPTSGEADRVKDINGRYCPLPENEGVPPGRG